MVDFIVKCTPLVIEETPIYLVWVLYVNGASNLKGYGAGAILIGLDGFRTKHALQFDFLTTNNTAEYEVLIFGLRLTSELNVQAISVFNDSQLIVNQVTASYEIKDPLLAQYNAIVARLKGHFKSFQINKILSEDNK